MRLLGVFLLVVTLSGCVGGHCGPQDQAEFESRELYARMPEVAAREGLRVEERAPEKGLSFEDETLRREWGEPSLTSVWRDAPGSRQATREALRVSLEAERRDSDGPVLSVTAPAAATEEDVRVAARRFLENVSAAERERQRDVEERLLASREPMGWRPGPDGEMVVVHYRYQAPVEGPFRLDALYAQLGGRSNAEATEHLSPGQETLRWGGTGWAFDFQLPTRSVRVPVEGATVQLHVDARGEGRASVPRQPNATHEDSLLLMQQAFGRLALDPPRLQESGAVVC